MGRKVAEMPGLGAVVLAILAGCTSQSSATGDSAAGSFTPGQVVEVLGGTAPADVPAGQCRTVEHTAWVTAVADVPLQATVDFGPDLGGLACDVAWQQIESAGVEKCQVNYGASSLYRNGRLLPISQSFGDCRCWESVDHTRCQVSTTAQCGYEVLQTQPTEVCN